MGSITGSKAVIGLKLGSTFGTAVAIGAGDKMEVEDFTRTEGTEELTKNSIGSGLSMATDAKRGATTPTVGFTKVGGYNDAGMVALAQMFGGASAALISTGAYQHSIIFNETANQKFATIAFQGASAVAGSFEYPSAALTEATIAAENPPNWVTVAMQGLANEEKLDSSANTYLTLNGATVADPEPIVVKPSDEFLINAQGGAGLASPANRVNIVSASFNPRRPQELVREIKGSAGNAQPVATADLPFQAELTVQFRSLEDLTWFEGHQDGDEYKARFVVEGPQIGASGVNYRFEYNLPRLVIVSSPDFGLSSPGNNPLTVVFKCLAASANPTGMISVYPYFLLRNARATSFLA